MKFGRGGLDQRYTVLPRLSSVSRALHWRAWAMHACMGDVTHDGQTAHQRSGIQTDFSKRQMNIHKLPSINRLGSLPCRCMVGRSVDNVKRKEATDSCISMHSLHMHPSQDCKRRHQFTHPGIAKTRPVGTSHTTRSNTSQTRTCSRMLA